MGQPLSLTFDHKTTNRAEIERRLKVTTNNGTEGSWGRLTETLTGKDRVDWRPKEYWKPGTRVTLERDGRTVKSIPITAGDPAKTPTWSGKMPLMAKEGTIRMKASSVGLTGYDQPVQKSMRLTVSGTFAHQAEWDATWFYDQARIGDVFEVTGGKETVAPGNGFGEWNLPWEAWQKLSSVPNSSPAGV